MGYKWLSRFRKATDLEQKQPKEALKLYGELARECLDVSYIVAPIALLFPSLGFLVAFYFQEQFAPNGTGFAVVIWWSLGFVPVWIWLIRREYLLSKHNTVKPSYFFTMTTSLFLLFGGLFQLFLIVFLAGLIFILITLVYYLGYAIYILMLYGVWIGLPSSFPTEEFFFYLPDYVDIAFYSVAFMISFAYFVTDIPIKRLYSLPLIIAAIKHRFKDILLWLIPLVLAFMLAGGYIENLFYDNVRDGVLMNVVIGLIIAMTYVSNEKQWLHLLNCKIGKARCLVLMERRYEAEYLLLSLKSELMGGGGGVYDHDDYDTRNTAIQIVSLLMLLLQKEYDKKIIDNLRNINKDLEDEFFEGDVFEVFKESIQAINNMVPKIITSII